MITVRICPVLIEKSLKQGAFLPPIEVIQGLPEGSRLLMAEWDFLRELIILKFSDPEPGPDREMDIVLRDRRFDGDGLFPDRKKSLHPLDRYLESG